MHEPYLKEWRIVVRKAMLDVERPVYVASCHAETTAIGTGYTEKTAMKDLISRLYSNLVSDSQEDTP